MSDLNKVVDDVFPKASINVDTDLTKAESLKPIFDVTMSSNVTTDVLHQGTGLVRSAVLLSFISINNEQRISAMKMTEVSLLALKSLNCFCIQMLQRTCVESYMSWQIPTVK